MKKLILPFLVIIVVLAGCDSTDDLYAELDKKSSGIVRDVEFTLTDDDYELLEDTEGAESIANFGNFSSAEQVETYLPVLLNLKFPQFGNGSSAIVTYAYFNGSSPYLGSGAAVTVSDQEYADLGFGFGNFDDLNADLALYANTKYPNASNGDYVDVTHDYYNGSFTETDVVSRVVYTAAYGWIYTFVLPNEAYGDFFGESGIDFSDEDEGEEKMPFYLNYLASTASSLEALTLEAGTKLVVQYNYDDRFTDPENPGNPNEPSVGLYVYDGSEWLLYADAYQISNETLSLARGKEEWVPDNTIKYTLAFSDWQFIGNAWADRNSAGSSSVLSFSNFDVGLWTEQQRFEAIKELLEEIFPNSEEGQKYLVSYATWEPGAGTRELYVILENGEYVLFEG
ncbi:MAG: hypothetical protein RIF46_14470 [Cyclobacteriaceae bacterium]